MRQGPETCGVSDMIGCSKQFVSGLVLWSVCNNETAWKNTVVTCMRCVM